MAYKKRFGNIQEIARKYDPDPEHSDTVRRLSLELFDKMGDLHGLGYEEGYWLGCAAILHDIGWSQGSKGHHKSSLRLILNDQEFPFTSDERYIIGSIARYHRKALPKNSHFHFIALSQDNKQKVRVLASILRIADGMDASHSSAVTNIDLKMDSDSVILSCFVSNDISLERESILKKKDLFESTIGKKLIVKFIISIMYSLIDVAPIIASILHVSLPKTDGVPIPAIVRDLNDYNKLILIIVDGLGLNLYEIFKHYFNFNGMVIGCKGVSMHTTPAIATILTGLYPHNHGVFETRHAYTSDPISVLELASIQGIKSAVIMEKIGAKSFRVDQVVEVDEEDAIKYDHQIKNALIEAAQKSVFTVAHFRILDRFYHENKKIEEAVEILSMNLKDVIVCWNFEEGKIIVDLARVPELAMVNGAIRLEAKEIHERVLVIQGDDNQYYAFQNRCTHGKRRLDLMPGMQQVQCCSIGKSIYNYNGKIISGSAKDDIRTYPVIVDNGKLLITL